MRPYKAFTKSLPISTVISDLWRHEIGSRASSPYGHKLHIVYVVAPGGGLETYVSTVLPELERVGFRVSVIYTSQASRRITLLSKRIRTSDATDGQAHYYIGKIVGCFRAWPQRVRAWERELAIYQALLRVHASDPVDVVEVPEGLHLNILPRKWTVIVRAHGSDWTVRHFCRDQRSNEDRWLVRLESMQLRRAHGICAVSGHLADHLSDFCEFPRDGIEVIPCPVDTEVFSPGGAGSQREIGLSLLTVGRLERRKGVDVLLAAMCLVWPRFPETKLYVTGMETEFSAQQLRAMVPAAFQQRLMLLAPQEHENLPGLYRRMAIYVAPSQYETQGLTILEAMACGVPVIATRVGAVMDLVEDKGTGLLVEAGDPDALAAAIETLLEDCSLRRSMGERARRKAVQMYNVVDIVDRLSHFYEDISAQHRGTAVAQHAIDV